MRARMTTARQYKPRLGQSIKPLIKAAKELNDDDMLYYAAALSYQVFFSSRSSSSFWRCWGP